MRPDGRLFGIQFISHFLPGRVVYVPVPENHLFICVTNPGNLTEEKESELEEFIGYAKIVMGTFGHKVFESIIAAQDNNDKAGELYLSGNGFKSMGRRGADGFVLLKGSVIGEVIAKSCPEKAIKDSMRYAKKVKGNIPLEDILFSSPSGAATFVCGYSISGNAVWKNSAGTTLKDIIRSYNDYPQSKQLPHNHNDLPTFATIRGIITTITKADFQPENARKPLQFLFCNGFSLCSEARKAQKQWAF